MEQQGVHQTITHNLVPQGKMLRMDILAIWIKVRKSQGSPVVWPTSPGSNFSSSLYQLCNLRSITWAPWDSFSSHENEDSNSHLQVKFWGFEEIIYGKVPKPKIWCRAGIQSIVDSIITENFHGVEKYYTQHTRN